MDLVLLIIFGLIIAHLVLTWWQALQSGWRASAQPNLASTLSDLPAVSVLIPAWREAANLHLTLDALAQVVYPIWEIILIAGGDDGTYVRAAELVQVFHTCPILIIEQQPKGKNAALNQGLAHAKHAVIVILDSDTLVDPDWLTHLAGALDKNAADCGNYFPLRQTWVSMHEQMEKISSYLVHGQIILQGSGSIAVKRDVLEQVGGFPDDVKVGVDWDLDTRISNLHLPKAFVSDACVRTQRPSTFAQFWKNEVRWRRAHLSALWRQRANPLAVFMGAKFYIVGFVLFGALILTFATGIMGLSAVALICAELTALYLLWILGRRAAIVAEVAAYTHDKAWLSLLGASSVLLLTSFAASWWALATVSRQTIHFKGPRS